MDDGWKTPLWDDTPITIPRRLLQEAAMALDDHRGLIQRLQSHEELGCLDTRDRRALRWGREALQNIRNVFGGLRDTPAHEVPAGNGTPNR